MDVNEEMCAVGRAIQKLQINQEDIRETVYQSSLRNPLDKTVKAMEALEKNVDTLEIKIESHSTAINGAKHLALQVLEQISKLTTGTKHSKIQCVIKDSHLPAPDAYTNPNDEQKEETYSDETKKPTESYSSYSVQYVTEGTHCSSNSSQQSKSKVPQEEKDGTGNETKPIACKLASKEEVGDETNGFNIPRPNKVNIKLSPHINDANEVGSYHEKGKPLILKRGTICKHNNNYQNNSNNENSKHVEVKNNSSQSILHDYRPSTWEKAEKGDNHQNNNLTPLTTESSNNLSESFSEDGINASNQQESNEHRRCCKEIFKEDRVFKNDFGYKQRRCNLSSDNRIRFYTRQQCFQGEPLTTVGEHLTETKTPSNINVTELDSMLAAKLAQEEEEHGISINQEPTEFNSLTVDGPRSIHDWLSYTEQLRIEAVMKGQTGEIKTSKKGHAYVLVLDCSKRMKGQKFKTMITAVKEYINGINMVFKCNMQLNDNIGLAVFGKCSTLISPPTCDYDMLLNEIDKLMPEGDAPLVGGLLLGSAGTLGHGCATGMKGFSFHPFTIVFTDSQSGNTSTETPELGLSPQFANAAHSYAEAGAAIRQVADTNTRIFFVPVEDNCHNKIMDMAVQLTKGKIVKPGEIHRLVRMTQTLFAAVDVASEVRFMRPACTRIVVREKVEQRIGARTDSHEDCIDMVLDLVDPMAQTGFYTEINCRTLSLGDRVRRGPHWIFDNQDSELPGTVIGRRDSNSVYVEWDSGYMNHYMFDENVGRYNIKKVNEYRKVYDDMVAVGCRVERGNDWTHDDDDGGRGCKGTVLNVNENGSVVVRWDCRHTGLYKMGKDGLIEIQLCDAPYTRINPDIVNEDACRHEEDNQTLNPDTVNEDVSSNNKNNKYIITEDSGKYIWEYEDEGEWKKFHKELNIRFEKCYLRKPNGTFLLHIDSEPYKIDFRRMKKVHRDTQEKIDIRRRS